MQRYSRIYKLLMRKGHSAWKATEILLDAKRGDSHARQWIWIAYKGRRKG